MPRWCIGWDVLCWLGHRRFARHWSVPQLRLELKDTHQIRVSDDAIARYIGLYQTMLAARQQEPARLAEADKEIEALVLTIDGLQPEKGHETLYVVRELTSKRVWFAEPLLSSAVAAGGAPGGLLVSAQRAKRSAKPVRAWMSDKQDGFQRHYRHRVSGDPPPLLPKPLYARFGQASARHRQSSEGHDAQQSARVTSLSNDGFWKSEPSASGGICVATATCAAPGRRHVHSRPPCIGDTRHRGSA